MDEKNGIFINDERDDEAMDIDNINIKQLEFGFARIVTIKLKELLSDGKLTCSELDEKLLEALKVLPVDRALWVLNTFQKSSSETLLDIINRYQSAANGPNEEKLKAILERTGYSLEVTAKQRKYGGPPPGWGDKSPPGPFCEVFVHKIPKTVFEDKLIPVFEEYGTIWSLRLCINPLNGQSRQYAFITYCDEEAAESAIEKLDGHKIDGGTLEALLSDGDLWCIMGNFLEDCNKDQIFDLADFLVTRPLKLDLKKHLDDIKQYQTILDLCKMLFEARNVIQELKSNSGNLPNNNSVEILAKIQNIIRDSSIDRLVETFLECFYFEDSNEGCDKAKKGFTNLLEAGAQTPECPTRLLEHMIDGMVWLADLKYLKIDKTYKMGKPLERFTCVVNRYRDSSAENIFYAIFKIHIAQIGFDEEERKQIGDLMAKAIKPIQSYTDNFFSYQPEPGLSSGMLIKRSALQIIYDAYGEFPVGNTTLLVELKAEIEDAIKKVVWVINKWAGCYGPDESDSVFVRSLELHIPEDHREWWSKYRYRSFEKFDEEYNEEYDEEYNEEFDEEYNEVIC